MYLFSSKLIKVENKTNLVIQTFLIFVFIYTELWSSQPNMVTIFKYTLILTKVCFIFT